jgi:hypothetical protein
VGEIKPANILTKVDFPAPFLPDIPITVGEFNLTEIFLKINLLPNVLVTFSNSIE